MAGNKLLVADDSLTIQKVIRLALSNEGYEIQAVSDGNDAIEQISVFRPDVVLIDVSLPGKTAFEVKRAINEHQDLDEIRFVLMSSAFEKVDEPQADEVVFHGRLTKPFDPAHLRQVLKDVLEQVAAKRREPTSLLQRPQSGLEEAFELPAADEPSFPAKPGGPTPPSLPTDDWLSQPLASDGPILSTPSPSDPVSDLWDHEPDLTALPPPLPRSPSPAPALSRPPAVPASTGDPDADIKHLTESTIRMSGLDDFQWSVSEPSLKPPASMLDTGDTTFQIDPPNQDAPPPFQPEPSLDLDARADEPAIHVPPQLGPDFSGAASPSDFYREPTPPAGAMAASLSHAQMEELIRKELRETFQRMAEKILPELAEKVIKQEIHRMLSETS